MTFAVASGYGIAICVATVTLILLPLMARPPAVARSSRRRITEGKQLRPIRPFW